MENATPPRLHLAGELDFAAEALRGRPPRGAPPTSEEIVLDASGLSFVDVSGCRALVETAVALKPPRRLVLTGASAALLRVLALCESSPNSKSGSMATAHGKPAPRAPSTPAKAGARIKRNESW